MKVERGKYDIELDPLVEFEIGDDHLGQTVTRSTVESRPSDQPSVGRPDLLPVGRVGGGERGRRAGGATVHSQRASIENDERGHGIVFVVSVPDLNGSLHASTMSSRAVAASTS